MLSNVFSSILIRIISHVIHYGNSKLILFQLIDYFQTKKKPLLFMPFKNSLRTVYILNLNQYIKSFPKIVELINCKEISF